MTSKDQCSGLPKILRDGCRWRFDWFNNATRPEYVLLFQFLVAFSLLTQHVHGSADYKRVKCPAALANITGCIRDDDGDFLKNGNTGAASAMAYSTLTLGAMLAVALRFIF